ncbi:BON domain-containing protein [soil metagenome]
MVESLGEGFDHTGFFRPCSAAAPASKQMIPDVLSGDDRPILRRDFIVKTNAQLQKDVMDEIKWEPCVTAAGIGVSVADGIVTLTGTVPTYAEKLAATKATQRVEGVKGIAEEIQIKPFGPHVKTDAEIASLAVACLKSHVWVPTDLQATVENGWVTLMGEVNFEFQQRAAHDSVRYLAGVKGVSNRISVKSNVKPTAVKDAIEKALLRNAEIDAGNIKVLTEGGTVTLSGNVRSWGEKEEAGWAAWNAPGVCAVQNDISVISA